MKNIKLKLVNGTVRKAERIVDADAYKKLLKIARATGLMPDWRRNLNAYSMDFKDFWDVSVRSVSNAIQQAYLLGCRDTEDRLSKEVPNDTHACKYCGGTAEGAYEDLLCADCREMFGHSLYSEL